MGPVPGDSKLGVSVLQPTARTIPSRRLVMGRTRWGVFEFISIRAHKSWSSLLLRRSAAVVNVISALTARRHNLEELRTREKPHASNAHSLFPEHIPIVDVRGVEHEK